MKLMVSLDDPNEIETPIKMADAIINRYMDHHGQFPDEVMLKQAENSLAAVAEHILVYLKYNRFKEE